MIAVANERVLLRFEEVRNAGAVGKYPALNVSLLNWRRKERP